MLKNKETSKKKETKRGEEIKMEEKSVKNIFNRR